MVELNTPEPVAPNDRGNRGPVYWPLVLAASVVVIVVAVWLLWPSKDVEETQEAAAPVESAEETSADVDEDASALEPLPSLEQSDAFVRRALEVLSDHPEIARWLAPEELIRRFAAAVDNVAEGVSPRAHLGYLSPATGFRAKTLGDSWVADPANYERFDDAVDAFVSLDTEDLAKLYRHMKPLIQEAYRDLGYPRRDFDEVLTLALRRLIQTPRISGDAEVVAKVRSYAYADPALEELTAPQKDLMRMGPRNQRLMQEKLKDLRDALGLR